MPSINVNAIEFSSNRNAMEKNNIIERLATVFTQSATVKNVYGAPITAGNKTIIPVSRIAYGLGGGRGQGVDKGNTSEGDKELKSGEGAGIGGGMYASAIGIYEITDDSSRFIPAHNTRTLIVGLVLGVLVKSILSRKRKYTLN